LSYSSHSSHTSIRAGQQLVATVNLAGGREVAVPLPMVGPSRNFTLTRK
jgi:hypothetical protein